MDNKMIPYHINHGLVTKCVDLITLLVHLNLLQGYLHLNIHVIEMLNLIIKNLNKLKTKEMMEPMILITKMLKFKWEKLNH